MKEITSRLHENRQIQLAKEILESAGYTVTNPAKSINESLARYADTDAQEETLSFIEDTAKSLGVSLKFGTRVGMRPQTVIIDHKYQDGIIRVSSNGSCEINGEQIGSYKDDYFDLRDHEYDIEDALKTILSSDEE